MIKSCGGTVIASGITILSRSLAPAVLLMTIALAAGAAAPGKSQVRIGKQTKETVGLVTDLSAGDVACYVRFTSDAGVEHLEMANFPLCEESLVGRRAKFRYERVRVLAPVCGGNPDCKHTVIEPVITSATVIDPALAPMRP